MTQAKNEILDGKIFPALIKFSMPILFSLILQALYGAVDLWMVGRFAVKADVSAVSTGSQTVLIVSGFVTGLSMGITVLLGQSMGERNDQRSADIIGTSAWIFTCVGILLTGVLLFGAPTLAVLLNTPAVAFDKTVHYILICGVGILFVVGFNVLSGIFCGLGDSKTPLLFVGSACIVNIAGDFVLIKVYPLGAVGAAIATITAQAVSVLFSFFVIRNRLPFAVTKKNMHFDKQLALLVVKLGAPIALLRMCNEISYLIIMGLVNRLGVVASSGVGIAEKIVMFIVLIPTAYMSAICAFVAQNVGAGQFDRAQKSMWVGMRTAAVIGGIMAYLSFFHGDVLSRLFINDAEVIAASAEFLKATAMECFVLSLAYSYNGYFEGTERTKFVMIQGLCAIFFVRMPYAYFASTRANPTLFNIGLSATFAAVFMLALCSVYYIIITRRTADTCMARRTGASD